MSTLAWLELPEASVAAMMGSSGMEENATEGRTEGFQRLLQ